MNKKFFFFGLKGEHVIAKLSDCLKIFRKRRFFVVSLWKTFFVWQKKRIPDEFLAVEIFFSHWKMVF